MRVTAAQQKALRDMATWMHIRGYIPMSELKVSPSTVKSLQAHGLISVSGGRGDFTVSGLRVLAKHPGSGSAIRSWVAGKLGEATGEKMSKLRQLLVAEHGGYLGEALSGSLSDDQVRLMWRNINDALMTFFQNVSFRDAQQYHGIRDKLADLGEALKHARSKSGPPKLGKWFMSQYKKLLSDAGEIFKKEGWVVPGHGRQFRGWRY